MLTYCSKQPHEINTGTCPTLQLKKLRQNVVKILAPKPYRQQVAEVASLDPELTLIIKMPNFFPEKKSSLTLTKKTDRMLSQYFIDREFFSEGLLSGWQVCMSIYGLVALIRFKFSILKKWEIAILNMSMIKRINPEIAAKRPNEFIIVFALTWNGDIKMCYRGLISFGEYKLGRNPRSHPSYS